MTELFPGVGAGSLLHAQLLADDRSTRIGAIYRIDYSEAVVLTHDRWKFDAGGIPQFSFLLATAQDVNTPSGRRRRGPAAAGRGDGAAVHGERPARRPGGVAALRPVQQQRPCAIRVLDVELDPFTKNRVSFTGLRCRILGTFYEDDVDGTKVLEFGADVDNFYATSTYRVLKPVGDGLSDDRVLPQTDGASSGARAHRRGAVLGDPPPRQGLQAGRRRRRGQHPRLHRQQDGPARHDPHGQVEHRQDHHRADIRHLRASARRQAVSPSGS